MKLYDTNIEPVDEFTKPSTIIFKKVNTGPSQQTLQNKVKSLLSQYSKEEILHAIDMCIVQEVSDILLKIMSA